MCERKIKRKTRLRNRLLLFRRNKHKRLLNRLNHQEEFPGRISEKLLNDSVCQFTNGKGLLQMNIREMENLIVLLHEEYDTINKDQCKNIIYKEAKATRVSICQTVKKNNY